MNNFIRAKGQKDAVNLYNVTSIVFSPDTIDPFNTGKIYHKIYFYYDSLYEEVTTHSEWSFQDKGDYDRVVSFLEGHIVEVL